MKVYVAARLQDKAKVIELHAKLKKLGYTITHDWTTHKNILPYAENLILAETYATVDINGVINADIFILLTNPEIGAGSAGELGAAIALNAVVGKPEVNDIAKNMFYYHPKVTRLADIETLLVNLTKQPSCC